MKPKEIQELLDFIASSGLAEVNIETENFKIAVKKYSEAPAKIIEQIPQPIIPVTTYQQPVSTTPSVTPQPTSPAKQEEKNEVKDSSSKNLVTIKSPMIGTFYRSANPENPAFVNVGDEVQAGQPVCIIEAMKLFNEIESDISGRIVKILVENASPVEYDQPLFLVEPK